MSWRDPDGREWSVVYLLQNDHALFDCALHDATHRGFKSDTDRRLYRFRQGDDRSMDPSAIAAQFASSRPTKSKARAIIEKPQISPDYKTERAAAVQGVYDQRRGMGRR
jgi:hypothetical protein